MWYAVGMPPVIVIERAELHSVWLLLVELIVVSPSLVLSFAIV
jgi:hypothetical protein